jgi:release factor glutamine methyltransferase
VGDLLREATAFLAQAGIEEPGRNADLLLSSLLGAERSAILSQRERPLGPAQVRDYADLLRKRAQHVPLQYLTGRVGFMDFELKADPRALIPRPETELLVETVLECVANRHAPVICDVGSGSGNIAIALARVLPAARVYATDVSKQALALAAENAALCGVAERVCWLHGDLLAPVEELRGHLDVICSNPPYVSAAEFDKLPPDIREHEPRVALLAGEDGTEFHRKLLRLAPAYLKAGGYLVLELPAGKAAQIRAVLAESEGMEQRGLIRDYAGIERILVAQRVQP